MAMGNIFSYLRHSYLFTCCVLVTFCFTSLFSTLNGASVPKVVIKEENFLNKITEITEKLENAAIIYDIGTLIECANELRYQIESYTGKRVNLHEIFEKTRNYLKNKGLDLSYSQYIKMRQMVQWKSYCSNSSSTKKEKDDLPPSFQVAVIMTLCGFFLIVVPNAVCQKTGWYLLGFGGGPLFWKAINSFDEKKEDTEKDDNETQ